MQLPEEMRKLDAIAAGFQRSQILFTALKANLFSELKEPVTAEEVAQRVDWSPRGTAMLLDGLLVLGLVEKKEGQYWNAPIAQLCLVPGAEYDQTHILAHKANGWETWARLDEVVQRGYGFPRGEQSEEELRAFICGMHDIAQQSAQAMVDLIDLSPYTRMLDVGGGPGSYTIAFLGANPKLEGVLFDRPQVIPIGQEQVEAAGLSARVRFQEGDITNDSLGEGYDLILVSNIIHSFSEEENQALVNKCHEALNPGGCLILKDFILEEDRSGPAFGLLFALHMLVHTEGGGTYTKGEVRAWTQRAGFKDGELLSLTPHSRLWMVRK